MNDGRTANYLNLSDGKRLCWTEYGNPGGAPVFLFHGNPGSRLCWGAMPGGPFLPSVRLIPPDRPDHGRTDFKPRALERWPGDVAELADHLHIGTFAVFGPSGGALYALACAWKIPDRLSAVGVFGAVGPNSSEAVQGALLSLRLLWRIAKPLQWAVRLQMLLMARAARKDSVRLVQRLREFELRSEDRPVLERPEIIELFRVDFPEAYRQNGIGAAYDVTIPASWPILLDEILIPVELWHAECDPLVGNMTRYLAEHLASGRLHILSGVGHLWILDHMPEVLATLVGRVPQPG